ncbi:MAG: hypothetical protein ACI4OJ_01825 [Lachnospiraceae bacterium]
MNSQNEAREIAKALLAAFSHREIRNFLYSNPMGVSIDDCREETVTDGGKMRVRFWLPHGGFADLASLLEKSGFDQEMIAEFLAHPECAQLSRLSGKEEDSMVLTLTRAPECMDRQHTENLLWRFLYLSGCRDLEELKNGILDAAEAANLLPLDPVLF